MKSTHRSILGIGAIALVASHCGGSTIAGAPQSAMDSGAPQSAMDSGDPQSAMDARAPQSAGDAGASPVDDGSVDAPNLCEGTAAHDGAPAVPAEHRAVAATCSLSQGNPETADGAAVSCSSNTDCQAESSLIDPPYCLGKQCRRDQCLVDSDCPSGTLCLCGADAGGGDIIRSNVCIPANCRLDSDCGANEYCSPSRGYCGAVSGFYCHSSRDTCVDVTTDCACGGNACVYAPTVGHFVCGTNVCMG
jgi:hypothetical protein